MFSKINMFLNKKYVFQQERYVFQQENCFFNKKDMFFNKKDMFFNKKYCNRDLLSITITKKQCWRGMLQIKWTDRITNDEVFERAKKERLLSKILQNGSYSWIGHIIRHNEFVVNILEGAISGIMAVGGQRLRYLEQVARNTAADSYTAMERMACNSSRWKAANQSKDSRRRKRTTTINITVLIIIFIILHIVKKTCIIDLYVCCIIIYCCMFW
jgi:hypothetical protein